MQLRSPQPADEPAKEPVRPAPAVARASFGVPAWVVAAKFGAAALLAVLGLVGLLERDGTQATIAFAAAAGLTVYGARYFVARERLRIEPDGLTVIRGYAGRQQVAWAELERVRVDRLTRFGARYEALEIDAGDHIAVLSRYDLGVDPEIALEAVMSSAQTLGGREPLGLDQVRLHDDRDREQD
jgi:hypothetical protein